MAILLEKERTNPGTKAKRGRHLPKRKHDDNISFVNNISQEFIAIGLGCFKECMNADILELLEIFNKFKLLRGPGEMLLILKGIERKIHHSHNSLIQLGGFENENHISPINERIKKKRRKI